MSRSRVISLVVFAVIFHMGRVAYDAFQGLPLSNAFSANNLIATAVATGLFLAFNLFYDNRRNRGD